MVLEVEKKDSRFRLKTPMFFTNWIANTEKNRQMVTWFLGEIEEVNGRKIFKSKELADVLEKNTVEVHNCINAYRYCGENAEEILTSRARKQLNQELKVEQREGEFRVLTKDFITDWWVDSWENKKVLTLILYGLSRDGKYLFKTEDLKKIANLKKSSAVNKFHKRFQEDEGDILSFLEGKRKLDPLVRETIREIVRRFPLENCEKIAERANERLKREDISGANVYNILEETGCNQIRKKLKKQLVKGQAHYKEQIVIDALFSLVESKEPKKAQLIKEELSLEPTEPTCVFSVSKQNKEKERAEKVFSGSSKKEDLAELWKSDFGWQLLAMCLYLQGVSTSTIGSWFEVDKSTISRWLDKMAFWGETYLNDLQVDFSGKVAVDEKWIKIAGCWWYLFAAVDCKTGFPLCTAIYSSNSRNYCKLFLQQLKDLGYHPKIIITDGWNSYPKAIKFVFPDAEHLFCRFHAIKSLFRRLKKAHVFDLQIWKKARKLFQTSYKRTVERRVQSLRESLTTQNKESALSGLNGKFDQLLKTVGSNKMPSTANAAERFFGAFDRLYRVKGPFPSEKSAQKHLNLFLLGYMFKIGSKGQPSPLEKTGFSVGNVPFYHLLNRPNILMLKERIQQQHLLAG